MPGRDENLDGEVLTSTKQGRTLLGSMKSLIGIVSLVQVSYWLLAACGGGGAGAGDARAPVKCGGEERAQLSCESEFKYEGRRIEGGLSALGVGSANAKTDETALRQIDQQTEQYAAQAKRLCEEYNACVVDKDTYGTRSENLRRRMAQGAGALRRPEGRDGAGDSRKALADAIKHWCQTAAP